MCRATTLLAGRPVDTLYIKKPPTDWTFRVRGNLSSVTVDVNGLHEGTEFSTHLDSELKTTLSITATYKGISAGIAVNPLKLAGLYKDYELNVNAYGNRMGADLVYANARNFTGTTTYGGDESEIKSGSITQQLFNASAYYAFNGSRFSLPAAFSQSHIQRQSAGSWLVGITYLQYIIDAEQLYEASPAVSVSMKSKQLGAGVGYGYNFVLRKGWLIHASNIPHLVLLNHTRLLIDGSQTKSPFRFPNLINVGRIAVIRNVGNRFYGLTAIGMNSLSGDREQLRFSNVKWRVRLCYGFRL